MTDPWTQDPLVREDASLRAFLDQLATSAVEPVPADTRIAELEALLTEVATQQRVPAAPGWRRRARRVLALTSAKVVLAAGVAAATTGGLAATGSLPAPVQQFAHEVGQQVGIGIPAAPGLVKHADGDPTTTGTDYAPGQLGKLDDDPGTNGSDHAPGQVGRTEDPGQSGDKGRPDDPGQDSNAPDTPPGQERKSETATPPDLTTEGSEVASEVQPTDAGSPTADTPGNSGGAPGQNKDDAPGNSGNAPGQTKDDPTSNKGGGKSG